MACKDYILLIDTSNKNISVARSKLDGSDFLEKTITSDKQAVDLPVLVEDFIKDIGFERLNSIGVMVGPGSFTGIRIGIAYAKGLSLGLNISLYPINAFEIYLNEYSNSFIAIDTGKGDFFVASKDINPCIMNIEDIETLQMKYEKTVGHKPYNLKNGTNVLLEKKKKDPDIVIPLYLRPSYVEK